MSTNVSKDGTASIFRVEGKAKRKTGRISLLVHYVCVCVFRGAPDDDVSVQVFRANFYYTAELPTDA
jgi:hypothetical protein